MALHVRFGSWYISLPSSAKQQREMTKGAFHYAKPTGQRLVGIPEENGTAFSD